MTQHNIHIYMFLHGFHAGAGSRHQEVLRSGFLREPPTARLMAVAASIHLSIHPPRIICNLCDAANVHIMVCVLLSTRRANFVCSSVQPPPPPLPPPARPSFPFCSSSDNCLEQKMSCRHLTPRGRNACYFPSDTHART